MANPATQYCTLQNLNDYFGNREVISFAGKDASGIEATATVTLLINMVSSEIEGAIRSTYKLPLPSIPPVLTRIACDMVRYYAYGDTVSKAIVMRYDNAVAQLKDIAAGKVDLGADLDINLSTNRVSYVTNTKVFTRDNLKVIT